MDGFYNLKNNLEQLRPTYWAFFTNTVNYLIHGQLLWQATSCVFLQQYLYKNLLYIKAEAQIGMIMKTIIYMLTSSIRAYNRIIK